MKSSKRSAKYQEKTTRISKPKTNQVSKIKFVTEYNPRLPKVHDIIKSVFQFSTMMMHSQLCFLKIDLLLFIKEIKI